MSSDHRNGIRTTDVKFIRRVLTNELSLAMIQTAGKCFADRADQFKQHPDVLRLMSVHVR